MSSVVFQPWEGKNYLQGYRGKRILVLGESHYSDSDNAYQGFTKDVVDRYVAYLKGENSCSETWMNTFTKFASAFQGGATSKADRVLFWERVSFYNFVQSFISRPCVKPTKR